MIESMSITQFKLFQDLIRRHLGIFLSEYKKTMLERRVAPRLAPLGLSTYISYYHYLLEQDGQGEEFRRFLDAVTIEKTEFFRHPKQFELLSGIALAQIKGQKGGAQRLRIWSAGCSTGEETYSIAMIVNEALGQETTWDIKILASDVDTAALKSAYRGQYSRERAQKVPEDYVERYFEQDTGQGSFRVKDSLKKNILFRRLNLAHFNFSFKSPIDIIFCRNVIIYFEPAMKERLMDCFWKVMKKGGFLFLGSSETLVGKDHRFSPIGYSTYQKKG